MMSNSTIRMKKLEDTTITMKEIKAVINVSPKLNKNEKNKLDIPADYDE
jgi:hypothetical protein